MADNAEDVSPEIIGALERVNEAIETLMAAKHSTYGDGGYPLLHSWVVTWEQVRGRDEDGRLAHMIDYAMSQGCSMGSSIGLMVAGAEIVRRDLIWEDDDE